MVRKAPRTAFYFIQSAMTGFTVSAFLSRNRVSPKEAFEGLELCERKLSCTVLRGLDGSNPVRLLGRGLPTGWPEVVTHLRLPQNGACRFTALRSSKVDSQYGDSLQLPVGEIQLWL